GGATLQLNTDGVFGIRKSAVTVSVVNDNLTVNGTADFQALGIQTTLAVTWDQATGLTISGTIPMPAGIPGIAGGSAQASVTRSPEGALSFDAKGTLTPNIPGLSAELAIEWHDDSFVASGTAGLKTDNLEGNISVGVTN